MALYTAGKGLAIIQAIGFNLLFLVLPRQASV